MEPSAFEPIDPATASVLLDRAKQRSAQLRRRRMLLLFGSAGGPRRAGTALSSGPGMPRRFTPSTMAFGTVGVVVAIVIALVAVSLTSKGPGGAQQVHNSPSADGSLAPVTVPASPTVLAEVTGVTPAVANAVGVPSTSTVVPPTVKTGQTPLTIGRQPGAVFIGGEFCPYCAAERWAIIMAFSRFGTFSGLSETTSSPWDTDPSTATFSFYGSSYSSSVVTLDTVENESNDTDGLGTRTTLQPLTDQESSLWQTYDNPEGFPFLDIGNLVFALSPSYDPSVLAGLDQQDIAAKLTDPNDPVTVAIVGTANYLTAAICAVAGPDASSTWCSQPAVTKAAIDLGQTP